MSDQLLPSKRQAQGKIPLANRCAICIMRAVLKQDADARRIAVYFRGNQPENKHTPKSQIAIHILKLSESQKEEFMKTRLFASLFLLGAALFLMACPSQTTVGRLNGDPARYRGKEVLVVGTVTNSYGAAGFGAYELDDETGKIWVLTKRGTPSKGARVGAVGRYMQGVNWSGRNYGSAIEETDRKVR